MTDRRAPPRAKRGSGDRTRPGRPASARPAAARVETLGDDGIAELESLLGALPAPLEPFDVSTLDGFLCGVVVQPASIARSRWLAHVFDAEGRAAAAAGLAAADRIAALVDRRVAELRAAVGARDWFDPWVFAGPAVSTDDDPSEPPEWESAVLPWVTGLAAALETFPALLDQQGDALDAALAPAFRFLDPADLEDADGLYAAIDELEPAASLDDAVEGLTRTTLLLADVAGLAEHRPPRR